ncbi:MAG: Ppx/GppA family phosphatase [Pseudomonadota bacterium]
MAVKKEDHSDKAHGRRRAVVDIGSNSVRLVVFEGPLRAPITICNEKALCGLGRDKLPDGSLNPDAVADALQTLSRFAILLNDYDNPPTEVIATAAVREAKDGQLFVEAVEALGLNVSILTGAAEAQLAAYGVISCAPEANGLVGDMGGGSLELVRVGKGEIKECDSLSIGPLTIMHAYGSDRDAARRHIEKAVSDLSWIKKNEGAPLYAVGGAWRAVAKTHMRLRRYPLSILHHYELSKDEAIEICTLLAQQSRRSLEEIPGIPRRRIDTLPFATMVLRSVIEKSRADAVIFSAGGVREGLLYRDLPEEIKSDNPLVAAAQFYAGSLSPHPEFGETIYSALAPLFSDGTDRDAVLLRTTCLLCDIGALFHPDHRAEQAFDTALRAHLVNITHPERICLALSLFRRYSGRSIQSLHERLIGLLSWKEQTRAVRVGLALRFMASLAPKVSSAIEDCFLLHKNDELIFHGPRERAALMGETPMKRFNALAEAFDAEPVLAVSD